MMTKTQYCEHVIAEFCYKEGISRAELTDAHVLSSSTLGVAMEHLGLLQDPEIKSYVSSRGGMHVLGFEGGHLSTREFIDMLPE